MTVGFFIGTNKMKDYLFDIECYINYFEVKFRSYDTGAIKSLMMFEDDITGDFTIETLESFVRNKNVRLVGFNSMNYDMVMLSAFLSGKNNQYLKRISDFIVKSGKPHWQTYKNFDLSPLKINHIDLMEPSPGVQIGLKLYGGRLGAPKMQDLPIDPDAVVTRQEANELSIYCDNDLDTTHRLYKAVKKAIELREALSEKYKVDLNSKSDAQIAEAILKLYLEAEGVDVAKRSTPVIDFKYRVPEWVSFQSPELNSMLEAVRETTFGLNEKGTLVMPPSLNKAIEFDDAKYKFGIGGLHSQEKNQVVVPAEDEFFAEWDVASMYPSIIIEQELYPKHLGEQFLDVYSNIKDERLEAKHSGDNIKNSTYKILLNGTYGKLNSKYSYLYSPELLIQTTITGQLSLLMLIEMMTLAGGKVMSANTDGVNVLIKKADLQKAYDAQYRWELLTSYELEVTPYKGVYSRDVNNYVALKSEGVKGKGAFAVGGLMKNPNNNVTIEAVINHLANGANIEEHIRNETDPLKFCCVRKVTGGATFRGEEVGKVVRFYHSVDGDNLRYKKNDNKVPKSDGCKPLMDLPDKIPNDIDYDWYISDAISQLKDLGVVYA